MYDDVMCVVGDSVCMCDVGVRVGGCDVTDRVDVVVGMAGVAGWCNGGYDEVCMLLVVVSILTMLLLLSLLYVVSILVLVGLRADVAIALIMYVTDGVMDVRCW